MCILQRKDFVSPLLYVIEVDFSLSSCCCSAVDYSPTGAELLSHPVLTSQLPLRFQGLHTYTTESDFVDNF